MSSVDVVTDLVGKRCFLKRDNAPHHGGVPGTHVIRAVFTQSGGCYAVLEDKYGDLIREDVTELRLETARNW